MRSDEASVGRSYPVPVHRADFVNAWTQEMNREFAPDVIDWIATQERARLLDLAKDMQIPQMESVRTVRLTLTILRLRAELAAARGASEAKGKIVAGGET